MMSKPKIIGFICNWSLPKEIGRVSSSRIYGYPKIRIVRVPCVGRIDPAIVLETFVKGADGVLVIGCPSPDCHYIEGNLQAEQKINMLKKLISLTGLEPKRLRLEWVHPSEIERFAKIIDDFRKQVIALGPSPLAEERPNTNILRDIKAAKAATEDFRLRVSVGRERELTEKENVYGEKISQEEINAFLNEIIKAEFIRHKIHLLTKEKPMSVKEIASITNMKPRLVLCHIVNMRRKGMITLDHVEKTTPLYKALEVQ
ncbi:MAG: hydrogenase iron-sulfur subunit [Candidatus Bathyarchaeota archaeon]|nr:MAG: hydrogenase iron-sulfur subunit [Candidatus Bathyarchaeota archaeon]